MVFEDLIEKGPEVPEVDWEGYYGWLYSELAGQEVSELEIWACEGCKTVNITCLPARYRKCRDCKLIHIGGHFRK